ncbi:MAG: alpha/beta hydrolase [Acidobacteriota bacterium]
MKRPRSWPGTILLLLGLVYGAAAQDGAQREPAVHVYAAPGGAELKAYVFSPDETGGGRRSAIVLLHGGGWTMGEPQWAFAHARHFADRGMVAIAAQYRLSDNKNITPLEAIEDVRATFRWVRLQANSLGVDPKRVAAYGWSAGAHLAVIAAILDTVATRGDVSGSPDALVLVSPAVSLASDGHVKRLLGSRAQVRDISPDEHVRKGLPPTLILQGNVDTVTPFSGAKRFCDRMRDAGNACELHVYEGFGHLFTPAGTPDDGWPKPDPTASADAMARADRFLESLGFLK